MLKFKPIIYMNLKKNQIEALKATVIVTTLGYREGKKYSRLEKHSIKSKPSFLFRPLIGFKVICSWYEWCHNCHLSITNLQWQKYTWDEQVSNMCLVYLLIIVKINLHSQFKKKKKIIGLNAYWLGHCSPELY